MIPDSPLEISFLIFGIVIGLLFVIDGWRGSPKSRDFRGSPRIRALLWVFGGLVSAFLVDIRKLGIALPDDKSRIIELYLAGFAGAAAAALLCMIGILIAQAFWSRTRRTASIADTTAYPFLPVLDYLHYGYSQFQETRNQQLEKYADSEADHYRKYLAGYTSDLAVAIVAVNNLRDNGGDASTISRILLRSIGQLTQDLLHVSPLNVNYMRAYDASHCPEPIKQQLRFVFGDSNRYSNYLALAQYANDMDREGFSLPVEPDEVSKKAACLLPGAPVAFRRNQIVCIEDTAKIDYPSGLNAEVVQNLKAYFQNKKFRSFLSIPIVGKTGLPVGVLNIDSNQKAAFGKNEAERESIANTVLPFCALLGAIISLEGDNQ